MIVDTDYERSVKDYERSVKDSNRKKTMLAIFAAISGFSMGVGLVSMFC